MEAPPLPTSVRRNADLFEIGFVFLLLPAIVATMDRPPFHLGGKILLWLGTWFLVRRLSDADRARVLAGFRSWFKPVPLVASLLGLALAGAMVAEFSGWERFLLLERPLRWISGALLLPTFALVVSLPVVILGWAYIPVRFADSVWFPRWFVACLPALGFATLHASTLGWKAPLAALLGASLALAVGRTRISAGLVVGVHALVGWMGVVGGVW